ncbi:MAG: phosphoglucosamine mutase [Actinomycetota bacterium]
MLKFGTDGVRGEFGTELTTSYVAALARAAAKVLRCKLVVIGRDTRESGSVLEAAIARSLSSLGIEVHLMGVAPTPAIAFAAASSDVVSLAITASHNPYSDNGVKIFGRGGRKLTDEQESQIESELAREMSREEVTTSSKSLATFHPEYLERYRAALVASAPKNALAKLHIALDCANGAMSEVASAVLVALGAKVSVIHSSPNGKNINHQCGATNPGELREFVKKIQADLGIAFDGDGDRLIAIDDSGSIVDGDHLIAISAQDMKRNGTLRNNKVAVTVMTNIGFHQAMKQSAIEVVTTPVGDRSVLIAIQENDLSLGGEQSGHIIYHDLATTGDGLLAAIRLAVLIANSSQVFSKIASNAMTSFPQVLKNIRVAKLAEDVAQIFAAEIATAEKILADDGRVLVRSSGTEPVVRVMVEAREHDIAESVAATLVAAITARLG